MAQSLCACAGGTLRRLTIVDDTQTLLSLTKGGLSLHSGRKALPQASSFYGINMDIERSHLGGSLLEQDRATNTMNCTFSPIRTNRNLIDSNCGFDAIKLAAPRRAADSLVKIDSRETDVHRNYRTSRRQSLECNSMREIPEMPNYDRLMASACATTDECSRGRAQATNAPPKTLFGRGNG